MTPGRALLLGLALGALGGLAGGLPAGRAWERYAYEMVGARERLGLARGYAGGAFRAIAAVVLVAVLSIGAAAWASNRDEAPAPAPSTRATPSQGGQ